MAKTEIIRARVTELEKQAYEQLAELDDRRPTEWLRETIRQAAQQQGIWPPRSDSGVQLREQV